MVVDLAKIVFTTCWCRLRSFDGDLFKKLNISVISRKYLSTYIIKKNTSWLVRLSEFYSVVAMNRKLTRSLRSLVRLRFLKTRE